MSATTSTWITPVIPARTGTVFAPAADATSRTTRGYDRAKRLFDVSATVLGLLVIAPLLVLIAVAIKLEDGGPVLFEQTRIGLAGVPFTIYKFRSMVVDAEARKQALASANEGASHLFKLRHDPRVTRLGRFLRQFSLDELPQLINVLRGNMSLVGPRPHLADEVARMSPEAQRRSAVRPGLTGLWQVSGRSNLDEAASISLDLQYVDRRSLRFDLQILRRTAGAVLFARGAH